MSDKVSSTGKKESKNTRNLHTTRKKAAKNWWPEIVLAPSKNGISKYYNLFMD